MQTTYEETYAATLAAQTLQAIIAIITYFDMESRQYNCQLAYLNAYLGSPIYAKMPPGASRMTRMLWIHKALYGLKESGFLWSQLLRHTLIKLGLEPVPGVDCLFTNGWLYLVFFVDNIYTIYHASYSFNYQEFEKHLLAKFTITALGTGTHFLGIQIIRDHTNHKTYIIQDTYIDKIASKYNMSTSGKPPTTPLPNGYLELNKGIATKSQIQGYQQKVGSLNYAAIFTRPDIAFAISRLSTFLQNPSLEHIKATDHYMDYVIGTKYLGLEFGNTSYDKRYFMTYSDIAYTDDRITRWSSFGYCLQLFGGTIHYKAAKQKTVTTSSTEAELLALSSTAKEYLYWVRFFENISLELDCKTTIFCDNTQTIRLCNKSEGRLNTRLKHIDIHSYWLC